MPSATETEKWAEWVYLKKGYVTDRALKSIRIIGPGKYISQRNDRFGMFDLIAIDGDSGFVHLVQVTRGKRAMEIRKVEIKKWCIKYLSVYAIQNIGISVFLYEGRPRKHFQRWQIIPSEKGFKWIEREDIPIPKKEEIME